jgi:hypothetical protein
MHRLEFDMHYVRIVTTHKGGATTLNDIRFAARQSAIVACALLKAQSHADGNWQCNARRRTIAPIPISPLSIK